MGFQASVQTEARISSAKNFNIRAHRPDQRQLAFVKVGGDIFSFSDDEKDYDDDDDDYDDVQTERVSGGTSLFDPLWLAPPNSLDWASSGVGTLMEKTRTKMWKVKVWERKEIILFARIAATVLDWIFMRHHIVKPQSGIDISRPARYLACWQSLGWGFGDQWWWW